MAEMRGKWNGPKLTGVMLWDEMKRFNPDYDIVKDTNTPKYWKYIVSRVEVYLEDYFFLDRIDVPEGRLWEVLDDRITTIEQVLEIVRRGLEKEPNWKQYNPLN